MNCIRTLLFLGLVAASQSSSAVLIRVDFEAAIEPIPDFFEHPSTSGLANSIGRGRIVGTLGIFDVMNVGDTFLTGGEGVRAVVSGLNRAYLNGELIHVPVEPHELSGHGSPGADALVGVGIDGAEFYGTRDPPSLVFTDIYPGTISGHLRFANTHRGLFLNTTGTNPSDSTPGRYHGLNAIPGTILVELWTGQGGEKLSWFANTGSRAINGVAPLTLKFTVLGVPTPTAASLAALACVGALSRRRRWR